MSMKQNVVLAQGFGLSDSTWRYVIPKLSSRYEIGVFNFMEHAIGNSYNHNFAKATTIEKISMEMAKFIEERDLIGCLFVGHSISGIVGALATIANPHLFKRIIMLGSSPRYINDTNYFGGFDREDIQDIFGQMAENYVEWANKFAPTMTSSPTDEQFTIEFRDSLIALRPDIALSIAEVVFNLDMRAILPKIQTPCIVLQTTLDNAVPKKVSKYMASKIPDCSIEIIDAIGHIPQLTSPDSVADAFLKYLQ